MSDDGDKDMIVQCACVRVGERLKALEEHLRNTVACMVCVHSGVCELAPREIIGYSKVQ